jgi:hypothetical protein
VIGQGRAQEQAGKVLAALLQGDLHLFFGISLGGHDKGEVAGLALKGEFDAEFGQGVGQLGHGAFMHARRAVDAERAASGSGHGGHQPAGGAGFVHEKLSRGGVLVLAVGIAATGAVFHARDHKHVLALLDGRAAGREAGTGAGDVIAVQCAGDLGGALCQGGGDEGAVRQRLGRRRNDGDGLGDHGLSSWVG